MKRRQKGSQVKEGELDKLTMCGKGPKQHDKKCKVKKNKTPKQQQNKRGIQSLPRTAQPSLISVTARAQVQALWNN